MRIMSPSFIAMSPLSFAPEKLPFASALPITSSTPLPPAAWETRRQCSRFARAFARSSGFGSVNRTLQWSWLMALWTKTPDSSTA